MNTRMTLALCLGLLLSPARMPAQDATNAPPAQPDPTKIRQEVRKFYESRLELSKLPPEERAKKQSELSKKQVQALQKLPPEERRVWMEEMRKYAREQSSVNSAARRVPFIKERLESLRTKKAEGKTTEQEDKLILRLERALEEMQKRQTNAQPTAPQTVKPAEKVEPARN